MEKIRMHKKMAMSGKAPSVMKYNKGGDVKRPGGFKSTQQKGNIVKGKLKSQKELKKITGSDAYKKADYQTKNKMLNVATHNKGGDVKKQITVKEITPKGRKGVLIYKGKAKNYKNLAKSK